MLQTGSSLFYDKGEKQLKQVEIPAYIMKRSSFYYQITINLGRVGCYRLKSTLLLGYTEVNNGFVGEPPMGVGNSSHVTAFTSCWCNWNCSCKVQ